jgi:hypothetical protein
MPDHKQVKKSFESQSLYIPLMHILGFNAKSISIKKCHKRFLSYLNDNNLENYSMLKKNVLNFCFNNFSQELFTTIYNNSTKVVWKIENRVFFNDLIDKNILTNKNIQIQFINLSSNNDFCAHFICKKAMTFKNPD